MTRTDYLKAWLESRRAELDGTGYTKLSFDAMFREEHDRPRKVLLRLEVEDVVVK